MAKLLSAYITLTVFCDPSLQVERYIGTHLSTGPGANPTKDQGARPNPGARNAGGAPKGSRRTGGVKGYQNLGLEEQRIPASHDWRSQWSCTGSDDWITHGAIHWTTHGYQLDAHGWIIMEPNWTLHGC